MMEKMVLGNKQRATNTLFPFHFEIDPLHVDMKPIYFSGRSKSSLKSGMLMFDACKDSIIKLSFCQFHVTKLQFWSQ